MFPRPAQGDWTPLAASPSGQALPPWCSFPSSRALFDGASSKGSRAFTRPVFPLPGCSPGRSRGPWASSPGFAPPAGRTRGRTPGRGLISNTDQELRIRHNRPPICEFTRCARPRVAPLRWSHTHSRSGTSVDDPGRVAGAAAALEALLQAWVETLCREVADSIAGPTMGKTSGHLPSDPGAGDRSQTRVVRSSIPSQTCRLTHACGVPHRPQ